VEVVVVRLSRPSSTPRLSKKVKRIDPKSIPTHEVIIGELDGDES